LRVSRFTFRTYLRVLPILLLAGFAAPHSALALQDAPAAQSSPNTRNAADAAIARAGAKETAGEDENVFRHTPLVQSISKAVFHDADAAPELREKHVEITARVFEYLNFAILFFGIFIPIARILPKMLRKRSETLKQDLDAARKATDEARSRLSAVEAKLASLDQEIAAVRTQVEEEAKHDEARIKSSIQEESARIVAAAEQEIVSAAAQARRGLRSFAADLAIEQAAKQMVLTPETDRALIAEFVGDVTKGGSN
jgi:F-type H+-transporting ATPase subunit b